MERGFETWAALQFRRELNRAVIQFKRDHPGVLEERTIRRHEAEKRGQKNGTGS